MSSQHSQQSGAPSPEAGPSSQQVIPPINTELIYHRLNQIEETTKKTEQNVSDIKASVGKIETELKHTAKKSWVLGGVIAGMTLAATLGGIIAGLILRLLLKIWPTIG